MEGKDLSLGLLITDNYWRGLNQFKKYGLGSLSSRYVWPKNKASKSYEETIELKLQKNKDWGIAVATDDSDAKIQIAESVIKEWGQIKNISKSTIADHVVRCEKLVDFPYKGVASYSKLLGIIEPSRYAILDARVVVSLNAIQLLEHKKEGIFFPYLAGRNRVTGDTIKKEAFAI